MKASSLQRSASSEESMRSITTQSPSAGQSCCPVCSKGFSCRGNMLRHMVVHTGNFRYKCSICDKNFLTRDNFTGHMNVHAGAKPFQCPNCLKCFSRVNVLSAHRKDCMAWKQNNA